MRRSLRPYPPFVSACHAVFPLGATAAALHPYRASRSRDDIIIIIIAPSSGGGDRLLAGRGAVDTRSKSLEPIEPRAARAHHAYSDICLAPGAVVVRAQAIEMSRAGAAGLHSPPKTAPAIPARAARRVSYCIITSLPPPGISSRLSFFFALALSSPRDRVLARGCISMYL